MRRLAWVWRRRPRRVAESLKRLPRLSARRSRSRRRTPSSTVERPPALSAAHGMNIHHLDVRTAHILLSGEGLTDPRKQIRVQITSFWADPRWRRSSLLLFPKDRQQYLAPEQFDDPQYVDDAADIFSLGCVFYEAITGKLPFDPLAEGEDRWKTPERPASLELDCPETGNLNPDLLTGIG